MRVFSKEKWHQYMLDIYKKNYPALEFERREHWEAYLYEGSWADECEGLTLNQINALGKDYTIHDDWLVTKGGK